MSYCKTNNRKQMNTDFMAGFLLLAVIIAELPAFSSYAGYILIISLALVVLVSVRTLQQRTLMLMLVIGGSWGGVRNPDAIGLP